MFLYPLKHHKRYIRNYLKFNIVFMNLKRSVFFVLFSIISGQAVYSEVRLPKVISDGMVLQRETPLKIWGWADRGEEITLHFNNNSYQTLADSAGNWEINLPPQKAGGAFQMKISGTNKITISNILLGDVWLCSGQSNMEYPFYRLTDKYADVISNCTNSMIRQFKVPLVYDFNETRKDYAQGEWKEANPESILNFSAVAYFMAKDLFDKYGIPIGIINASLGGSPAEAWMSEEALKDFPHFLAEKDKYTNDSIVALLQKKEQKSIAEWYNRLNEKDLGLKSIPTWKAPQFDDSSWPEVKIPGYIKDKNTKLTNGSIWLRRTFNVPKEMNHKQAKLFLGRIKDADSVFINDTYVGSTSYQYPQRIYKIPEGILKTGQNGIVVRLISNFGQPEFVKDKPYSIIADNDTIELSGKWRFQTGAQLPPTPSETFVRWKPTGLYNAMFAPSNNFAIKGAVWYQGESNIGRHTEYEKLLTALISSWRQGKNQGNFPFIIVQLPNYLKPKNEPVESEWAEFRNAQMHVAQQVENVAYTVNLDLGDWNDIHPQNKKDVGVRIALAAQSVAYKEEKVVAFGPEFESMKVKNNRLILTFDHCGSGLVMHGGKELKQFAIAAQDGKYVWAKAQIKGNKVEVWSDLIQKPVFVRYAWADNPEGANLYNKEGLPAHPFEAVYTVENP